jgi:hypothetical protein
MFVDEVGHAMPGRIKHENDRYLSLTGVIIDTSDVTDLLNPNVEALKEQFFGKQPDGKPHILHRKELVHRKPPFNALQNPIIADAFDRTLMMLLKTLDFAVVTVVLDKLEFSVRYKEWRQHPYHYCTEMLAERFVLFLEEHDATGDIVAEARGRSDDAYFKNSVGYFLRYGNQHIGRERFTARIRPSEPKLYRKSDNIAGLQLADMIAHPSFIGTKLRRQNKPLPDTFGGRMVELLEQSKYRRGPRGIWGYGRKWIPS